VIAIEKRSLEEILTNPEPLSYKDLSFIAEEILPQVSQLSGSLLEKLEQRLKVDIEKKKSAIHSEDLRYIPSLREIERMKDLGIEERMKKYLIAECGLEYTTRRSKLLEEVRSGRMSYEEFERIANEVYNGIYSICPGSPKEWDFVRRPYQSLPVSRVTDKYVKRNIEPEIDKMVRKRIQKEVDGVKKKLGLSNLEFLRKDISREEKRIEHKQLEYYASLSGQKAKK